MQAVCTLALVGKLEACKLERMVVGKLVCKLERMVLVGTQERKQVCILEHMVLVVGKLERILARKQACILVVGTQEHMVVGKLEHTPAYILERMEQAVGRLVCKPVVHTQVDMVGHSIQMRCSRNDCRNIPPIGALSCTEEATRH